MAPNGVSERRPRGARQTPEFQPETRQFRRERTQEESRPQQTDRQEPRGRREPPVATAPGRRERQQPVTPPVNTPVRQEERVRSHDGFSGTRRGRRGREAPQPQPVERLPQGRVLHRDETSQVRQPRPARPRRPDETGDNGPGRFRRVPVDHTPVADQRPHVEDRRHEDSDRNRWRRPDDREDRSDHGWGRGQWNGRFKEHRFEHGRERHHNRDYVFRRAKWDHLPWLGHKGRDYHGYLNRHAFTDRFFEFVVDGRRQFFCRGRNNDWFPVPVSYCLDRSGRRIPFFNDRSQSYSGIYYDPNTRQAFVNGPYGFIPIDLPVYRRGDYFYTHDEHGNEVPVDVLDNGYDQGGYPRDLAYGGGYGNYGLANGFADNNNVNENNSQNPYNQNDYYGAVSVEGGSNAGDAGKVENDSNS